MSERVKSYQWHEVELPTLESSTERLSDLPQLQSKSPVEAGIQPRSPVPRSDSISFLDPTASSVKGETSNKKSAQ